MRSALLGEFIGENPLQYTLKALQICSAHFTNIQTTSTFDSEHSFQDE